MLKTLQNDTAVESQCTYQTGQVQKITQNAKIQCKKNHNATVNRFAS